MTLNDDFLEKETKSLVCAATDRPPKEPKLLPHATQWVFGIHKRQSETRYICGRQRCTLSPNVQASGKIPEGDTLLIVPQRETPGKSAVSKRPSESMILRHKVLDPRFVGCGDIGHLVTHTTRRPRKHLILLLKFNSTLADNTRDRLWKYAIVPTILYLSSTLSRAK
jgi:hypothetical protein